MLLIAHIVDVACILVNNKVLAVFFVDPAHINQLNVLAVLRVGTYRE
jgi:hypothetical protein